jgi:hypothetical protein
MQRGKEFLILPVWVELAGVQRYQCLFWSPKLPLSSHLIHSSDLNPFDDWIAISTVNVDDRSGKWNSTRQHLTRLDSPPSKSDFLWFLRFTVLTHPSATHWASCLFSVLGTTRFSHKFTNLFLISMTSWREKWKPSRVWSEIYVRNAGNAAPELHQTEENFMENVFISRLRRDDDHPPYEAGQQLDCEATCGSVSSSKMQD